MYTKWVRGNGIHFRRSIRSRKDGVCLRRHTHLAYSNNLPRIRTGVYTTRFSREKRRTKLSAKVNEARRQNLRLWIFLLELFSVYAHRRTQRVSSVREETCRRCWMWEGRIISCNLFTIMDSDFLNNWQFKKKKKKKMKEDGCIAISLERYHLSSPGFRSVTTRCR